MSRNCLRALGELHETAADGLATALSALLRCPVEVGCRDAAQMSYANFLDLLANATHINLLRAKPSGDALLLDIELPVVYPMIDRLLGGCREDEPPPRRPLSDIEQPLAARLVRSIVQVLSQTWSNAAKLKIEWERAESNPRLIRAMTADEMVVVVEFLIAVGARRGTMRFCIPCRTVQPLGLCRPGEPRADRQAEQRPEADDAQIAINSMNSVELSVTLASTPINAAELMSLQVGDIVATETSAAEPAVVSLCGEPKYLALPGACRGRKAVRITAPIRSETS